MLFIKTVLRKTLNQNPIREAVVYCKRCGSKNEETNHVCSNCGALLGDYPLSPVQPEGREPVPLPQTVYNPENFPAPDFSRQPVTIRTYLVPAILVTLFCCIPFGIPAIIHAATARSKIASNEIEAAIHHAGKAKMWVWIGFGTGLAVFVLYFLAGFLGIEDI